MFQSIPGPIMFLVVPLSAVGFAYFTVAWAVRWRGAWRWVALLPAAGVAFVMLRIVLDVGRDRTAHNLWPIELLIWGSIAFGALLIIGLCRTLFVRFGRSGGDHNGVPKPPFS